MTKMRACGHTPLPTLPHKGGGEDKRQKKSPSPSTGEGWGGGALSRRSILKGGGALVVSFSLAPALLAQDRLPGALAGMSTRGIDWPTILNSSGLTSSERGWARTFSVSAATSSP